MDPNQAMAQALQGQSLDSQLMNQGMNQQQSPAMNQGLLNFLEGPFKGLEKSIQPFGLFKGQGSFLDALKDPSILQLFGK